jgi:hypothetical protein
MLQLGSFSGGYMARREVATLTSLSSLQLDVSGTLSDNVTHFTPRERNANKLDAITYFNNGTPTLLPASTDRLHGSLNEPE